MDQHSLQELTPGSLFAGRFRIIEKMAEGGMGAVYRVEQCSNNRVRALKVLLPEFSNEPKFRERFELEARIGARIASAHVVDVIDAGIDDATNTPWLAMELLQGRALDARIEGGARLSIDEAWSLLVQLADVLGAAHEAGVVHLDLKPENLFLAEVAMQGVRAPVLKVLDFGISKVILEGRTSTEVTTTAGSPLWMAPEQTAIGARLRPSSDVWSVGLIVFRLLTGHDYWLEANAPKMKLRRLLAEVLFEPLAPASERARAFGVEAYLPAGFDAWFAHCVDRDADKRFQHARACFNALYRTLYPTRAIEPTVQLTEAPRPPVDVAIAATREATADVTDAAAKTLVDFDAATTQPRAPR